MSKKIGDKTSHVAANYKRKGKRTRESVVVVVVVVMCTLLPPGRLSNATYFLRMMIDRQTHIHTHRSPKIIGAEITEKKE